jgi:deoxyguanosine kinase
MAIIGIEGIIGAGKTTFAKKLAEYFGLRAILEPVDDNPLLNDFYAEMDANGGRATLTAFPMQMWLMARRHTMQQLAAWDSHLGEYKGTVLDRTLPGDRVFCKLHVKNGNINEKFWTVYEYFYDVMSLNMPTPNLIVFLDVDPQSAFERKNKRGRACESRVPLAYFRELHRGYLDLMAEIESGAHRWSRGLQIMRVPWNVDDQDPTPIFKEIGHICRF